MLRRVALGRILLAVYISSSVSDSWLRNGSRMCTYGWVDSGQPW